MSSYMVSLNIFLSCLLILSIIFFVVKEKKNVVTDELPYDYAVVVDSVVVLGSEGFVAYTQPPNAVIMDIYVVPIDTFSEEVEAWVSLENDHTGNDQEIVAPTVVVTSTPLEKFKLPITDYLDEFYDGTPNLLSAPAFTENTERTVYFGIDTTNNDTKQMQFIVMLYEYKIGERNIISPYSLSNNEGQIEGQIKPLSSAFTGQCPGSNRNLCGPFCGAGQTGCPNTNTCHCPIAYPRWWNHRCKELWPSNRAGQNCRH